MDFQNFLFPRGVAHRRSVSEIRDRLDPENIHLVNARRQFGRRIQNFQIDRRITEFTPDAVIFDFIRQLENGNARAVWKTLLREGDGGESLLFPLLTLMAREARTLWQMLAGEKVFVPQYVEAEKRRLAAKLGFEGLTAVFEALSAAELAVKTGARSPLQAMEELVAKLSK